MKYPMIEKYMEENGISQAKLSRLCDIPYTTLNNFLNGRKDIKKSDIDKILQVTGMTYEECFSEYCKTIHGNDRIKQLRLEAERFKNAKGRDEVESSYFSGVVRGYINSIEIMLGKWDR